MIGTCYFPFMPRLASPVCLTEKDRLELERWVAAHLTPQQVAQRCQIVLSASRGQADKDIANELEINFKTVALWRKRFINEGSDCLWEVAEGRGRKPTLRPQDIERIVDATLRTKPAGATHWSCRTMAKAQGVSKATVNRIWQSHQIKPHLTQGFKLSRDPHFLEKLTDVVGLYLNPPQKALVLCVDEKSQIQALDRTQPGLPLKKGRCGTMTHDYKRNGTTTLFAALEVAQGKVIGQCYARHRHQEFLKFLQRLDAEFTGEVKLHVVMDRRPWAGRSAQPAGRRSAGDSAHLRKSARSMGPQTAAAQRTNQSRGGGPRSQADGGHLVPAYGPLDSARTHR